MKFAISDANIFIDLFAIELIDCFFKLNLVLHTTDLVISELDFEEQTILMAYSERGLLTIKKLDDKELDELKETAIASRKLSKPDVSIYAYAKALDAMILTSDRPLRKEAEAKGFEVHGVLWLFDQLINQSIITQPIAVEKMTELMRVNTWLPKNECMKRIEKWKE